MKNVSHVCCAARLEKIPELGIWKCSSLMPLRPYFAHRHIVLW
jgi:hypothetical protein